MIFGSYPYNLWFSCTCMAYHTETENLFSFRNWRDDILSQNLNPIKSTGTESTDFPTCCESQTGHPENWESLQSLNQLHFPNAPSVSSYMRSLPHVEHGVTQGHNNVAQPSHNWHLYSGLQRGYPQWLGYWLFFCCSMNGRLQVCHYELGHCLGHSWTHGIGQRQPPPALITDSSWHIVFFYFHFAGHTNKDHC